MVQKNPLMNVELFEHLPPHLTARIQTMLVSRQLTKHETLFQKGDVGDGLYVVVSGEVQILAVSFGGKEASLNIMKPGDVFGEIALLDGRERTADAMATVATEVSFLPRMKFKNLLLEEPEFGFEILMILCGRLRRMSGIIEDFLLLDVRSRLARQLITTQDSAGDKTVHLSQEGLAHFLGTSRVTVNRHLQEWKKEGWITLSRGSINIINRTALENVIEARLSDYDHEATT